jgi:hypothetical protein
MSYQIRVPEYLSPSSIKIAEKDWEDYAVKYLLNKRPPRPPQTQPMSVGSAFDAYAKSYIYYALFGNYGPDNQYELETILRDQVEPHNLEWARGAGKDCFDKYKAWGALADLMTELQKALGPPRFEFSVKGLVKLEDHEAVLLGKPDVYFVSEEGIRVVYDFKVNGYCGKRNTSPMKGYVCCRNGKTRVQHKNAVVTPWHGIMINCMMHLEDGNKEWADQLSIYSWLLGEPVGSEKVLFGIDQLTGPGCSRISSHRLRIKPEWQFSLMERAAQIWRIVQSGHIFREMSREESDNRLQVLEDTYGQPNPVDEILS